MNFITIILFTWLYKYALLHVAALLILLPARTIRLQYLPGEHSNLYLKYVVKENIINLSTKTGSDSMYYWTYTRTFT